MIKNKIKAIVIGVLLGSLLFVFMLIGKAIKNNSYIRINTSGSSTHHCCQLNGDILDNKKHPETNTPPAVVKKMGGESVVTLPKKYKLIYATWKEDSLWLLYRPFRAGEKAETFIYKEESGYGIIEGTVYIKERE